MNGDDSRLFPVDAIAGTKRRLRLRRASDGVVELREFGGWTLEKLRVMELYLKKYREVAGNGSYIDGFAGQGSLMVADSDLEKKGSVRLALEARAFKTLWIFEVKQQTMHDLTKNLSYWYPPKRLRRVHPILGDFNIEVARVLAEDRIPRDKPCFAFLDPNSTELLWDTVELLARYKEPVSPPTTCKIELWILFNTHQAFARLIDRKGVSDYATSGRAAALDRVMGGRDVWWPLFERQAHINAYARCYAERLTDDLGYGFAHPQIIRDPGTGRPQYFMIHASDHPAAHDFMRWAKKESMYFDDPPRLPGFDK